MNGATWLRIGAVSGAIVVILGTFLAHSLRVPPEEVDKLSRDRQIETIRRMEVFEIGTRYQMYHSLALVAVGLAILVSNSRKTAMLNAAGWAFLVGNVLFPGSLYLLGIGGPKWLGMIAPIGGLSFIVGWITLALAATGTGKTAEIDVPRREMPDAGDFPAYNANTETMLMP